MKKLQLFISLVFIPGLILAQTLKTSVFSAGGCQVQTAVYTSFGTFGQPLSVGTTGTNYQSKEGFIFAQQNSILVNISANQTICYNTAASVLNSAYTGAEGNVTLQWQVLNGTVWENIPGATSGTFNPEILTQEKRFRLLADDKSGIGLAISDTAMIVVRDEFIAGAIETTGEGICINAIPSGIGSAAEATGGDGSITYSWRSSTDNYTSEIAGATNAGYTPPAGLTATTSYRRYANDGICHTSPLVSSGTWTVTIESLAVSGALEKIPNTAEICEGTMVSANVTPGTGGNGTDSTSYRIKSLGIWSVWKPYTTGTAIPTTGTTDVEIRTKRKANYCTDAAPNTASWQVTPGTQGGSVTGGTSVCYGSNSTVITLSGNTGTVQGWQYSTDGLNWLEIPGQTATTYTVVNLTVATSFRALVKSGSCPGVYSDATSFTVNSNFIISGLARYYNNPLTPLNGIKVILQRYNAGIPENVDSTETSASGYYAFDGLTNASYGLQLKSAHPSGQWQTWGGVNNTDYLLVSRHATGVALLPENPPVVRISANVKNPVSTIIDLTDATAVKNAAKYGWFQPGTSTPWFDIPKWVFSGTSTTLPINGISLECSSLSRDILGLCAGDVNGSFIPGAGYKNLHPVISLENRGILPVSDEMVFPLRISQSTDLGALTLYLNYNPASMEITRISMPENGGEEPYFETRNGVLLIGWMSMDPVRIVENQTMVMIHARLLSGTASPIRFTLNENPLSELADGEGNVIDGVKLTLPDAIGKTETTDWRNSSMTVYPNPANETLNIEFTTSNPEPTTGTLELVNSQGIGFVKQDLANMEAGWHKTQIDVRNLAPGIYFLRGKINNELFIKKVIITR